MRALHRALYWLDTHAGAIQAFTAIVVAILTAFLVWLTRSYVRETDEALDLARDQLKTMREQSAEQERALNLALEQFEREWKPNLRIANADIYGGVVRLRLVNLAHPAALVKELWIGTGATKDIQPQNVEFYPITDVVPGGVIHDAVRIQEFLSSYRGKYNPPRTPLVRSPWQSVFNLAVLYDCATEPNIVTEWFNCSVSFEDFAVTKVERLRATRGL